MSEMPVKPGLTNKAANVPLCGARPACNRYTIASS
jgi:hypothetical protein